MNMKALAMDKLENVSGGGAELNAAQKEHWFKVARKAMDAGCTKEEFLQSTRKMGVKSHRIVEYLGTIWELAAVTKLDITRKHSNILGENN